jgi:hypothetical protein
MTLASVHVAASYPHENDSKSDWILLEDGELKGMTIIVDHDSGDVLSLSTRLCRDEDRWTEMPSLTQYSTLQTLDLHNSRHLSRLSETIGSMKSLRRLILSRCYALTTLPVSLGELSSLQEVRRFNRAARTLQICWLVPSGSHEVPLSCLRLF